MHTRLTRRPWLLAALPVEGGAAGGGDGGAGGAGAGAGAGGTGAVAPGTGAEAKTYDEAHVQRVGAQQKAEGERVALAKVAETLGVTVEEAKKIIDEKRAADDKEKSEAQLAREAADREKAVATTATAAAAQETLNAKITQALLASGVDLGAADAKDEDRAEKLGMVARLVNVAPGADDATIKAAIERVKTNVPALFAPAKPGGTQSDPGGGPPKAQVSAGDFGKNGQSEFERRHPRKEPVKV